jgi:hypothetical protein
MSATPRIYGFAASCLGCSPSSRSFGGSGGSARFDLLALQSRRCCEVRWDRSARRGARSKKRERSRSTEQRAYQGAAPGVGFGSRAAVRRCRRHGRCLFDCGRIRAPATPRLRARNGRSVTAHCARRRAFRGSLNYLTTNTDDGLATGRIDHDCLIGLADCFQRKMPQVSIAPIMVRAPLRMTASVCGEGAARPYPKVRP